jgi:signal transduction histidine kinase
MEELRTLSYLLHPPMLDELGLASAIRWYAFGFEKRSGISTTVEAPEDFDRLDGETETTLFRVVQEGLGNVHRHSGSRDARITLNSRSGLITLEIADHGKGISVHSSDATNVRGAQIGVGIAGMRLRLQQLCGAFEITSSSCGTTLRAIVPRRVEASSAIAALTDQE